MKKSDDRYLFLMLPGVAVVISLYYLFDPDLSSLFPSCPFHEMTGWSCPGCGSQRALHALLHGDVRTAMHYNPLFVVSVPFVTSWWASRQYLQRNVAELPGISRPLVYGMIAFILVSFAVFRNVV